MMTNLTESIPSPSDQTVVWSPSMTVVWTLAIFCLFLFGQLLGFFLGVSFQDVSSEIYDAMFSGDEALLNRLSYEKDLFWPMALGGAVMGLISVAIAIRWKKGLTIKEYLHLNNVPWYVWGLWILITVIVTVGLELLASNFEDFQTPFLHELVSNSQNIPLLILSIGIVAPVFEEVLFRGFAYKGLER
ncbi:MAG: hypothetical protein HKN79_09730, partial [Flavobacteriales bacterium]|nr:hypothetical protein [Flavobacteriales bacterium]